MSKEFYIVAKIGDSFPEECYGVWFYNSGKEKTKEIFSSQKIEEFRQYLKLNKEKFGRKVFVLRGFPNRKGIEEIFEK